MIVAPVGIVAPVSLLSLVALPGVVGLVALEGLLGFSIPFNPFCRTISNTIIVVGRRLHVGLRMSVDSTAADQPASVLLFSAAVRFFPPPL